MLHNEARNLLVEANVTDEIIAQYIKDQDLEEKTRMDIFTISQL